jgi:hypothetical protein
MPGNPEQCRLNAARIQPASFEASFVADVSDDRYVTPVFGSIEIQLPV